MYDLEVEYKPEIQCYLIRRNDQPGWGVPKVWVVPTFVVEDCFSIESKKAIKWFIKDGYCAVKYFREILWEEVENHFMKVRPPMVEEADDTDYI